jgi:transposase
VHFTETCDPGQPHLITHVSTPSATTSDVTLIPEIHAALAKLDLLPTEHLVDGGYTSADNVLTSRATYGVRLIGPVGPGGNWQTGVAGGVTQDQFQLDYERQVASCPEGQPSQHWSTTIDAAGHPCIKIRFPRAACAACASRPLCTKSTKAGRTLRIDSNYAAMRAARQEQTTPEFAAEYALRAGIEGTISAAVRAQGVRRARYVGEAKTHVQTLLSAIAINLQRTALWLMGERPKTTRLPSLACLAPAQLAV